MHTLPAAFLPLIITDPPYGIGYHSNRYKTRRNPHAPVGGDWNFSIGAFITEAFRVLADQSALYLFCRWDVMPLWLPYLKAAGFNIKTVIAWGKDSHSAGDLQGCFGNQYEQIIFAVKGRHLLRGRRWSNVWTFPRVHPSHMLCPTQKPVALLERAILASSDPGDLVFDPFTGSGSTGEACQHCGRNFLLTDNAPLMVRISCKRLGLPAVVSTAEGPGEIPPFD